MRRWLALGCVLLMAAVVVGVAASPTSPVAATPDGPPPVTTATGVDGRWHNHDVTVTFSATSTMSTVAATFVQVDGGPVQATAKVVIGAPRSHANDGEHILTFWSKDADGRTEAPRTATVRIDTRPPTITRLRLRSGVLDRVQPMEVLFSLAEPSGRARVSYSVRDQYGYLSRRGRNIRVPAGPARLTIPNRYSSGRPFTPGMYRVQLKLTDEAGNTTLSRPLVVRDYHPTRASVLLNLPKAGRRVALSFDDGGPSWVWAGILNVLKKYRMRASFFILTRYVSGSPHLARRTALEGHGIGSHGTTHAPMTSQSATQIRRELQACQAAWWRAARATPVGWVRPPYGDYNRATLAAVGAAGYSRVVLWDVDPRDWQGGSASTIASSTLAHVHPGAIICLHVRPATLAALPTILKGLRARGYRSVSLPELLHAAGRR